MTFLSNPILLLPTSVFLQAVEQALWKEECLVAAVLGHACPVTMCCDTQSWGAGRWDLPLGTGFAVQPQEFSYPRDPSAKESLTGREPGEILCARNFLLRILHDADTIQTAVMGQSAVASPAGIRTK